MSIGDEIRRWRLDRGMTQDTLAKAAQTSFQNIYKYEQGIITNIPLDKIERIAAALEVEPAELVGWTEDGADNEIYQLREELRRRPGMRILFSAARDVPDKDLLKVAKMIEVFKEQVDVD